MKCENRQSPGIRNLRKVRYGLLGSLSLFAILILAVVYPNYPGFLVLFVKWGPEDPSGRISIHQRLANYAAEGDAASFYWLLKSYEWHSGTTLTQDDKLNFEVYFMKAYQDADCRFVNDQISVIYDFHKRNKANLAVDSEYFCLEYLSSDNFTRSLFGDWHDDCFPSNHHKLMSFLTEQFVGELRSKSKFSKRDIRKSELLLNFLAIDYAMATTEEKTAVAVESNYASFEDSNYPFHWSFEALGRPEESAMKTVPVFVETPLIQTIRRELSLARNSEVVSPQRDFLLFLDLAANQKDFLTPQKWRSLPHLSFASRDWHDFRERLPFMCYFFKCFVALNSTRARGNISHLSRSQLEFMVNQYFDWLYRSMVAWCKDHEEIDDFLCLQATGTLCLSPRYQSKILSIHPSHLAELDDLWILRRGVSVYSKFSETIDPAALKLLGDCRDLLKDFKLEGSETIEDAREFHLRQFRELETKLRSQLTKSRKSD